MKTIFKSFFKFLQSIFLQVILGFAALITFNECKQLGDRFEAGTYMKRGEGSYEDVGTSIEAGFNGGAFAMGIVCSVCIIMIVWLEINKKSNK